MIEQVYTDEQLDAMSQDELKAEYERVMNFGKYYGKPDYFHWKRFERLIRRYESLILRAEAQKKYKMCITCKYYVHEIDQPSKGNYDRASLHRRTTGRDEPGRTESGI